MNSKAIKKRKDIPKWRLVERPEEEQEYNSGSWTGTLGYFVVNFGIAWLYMFLSEWVIGNLPVYSYGYDMKGNAIAYFIYFFMMVIPWIIGGTVHSKLKTPKYSFACLGGWFIAGFTFLPMDQFIGFYQAYASGLIIFANIPSQKDWILYYRDMVYYFILGIVDCYINTEIMVASGDIWVYIQFVHIYLFTVIAVSLKIDKWAYFFMGGWAAYSLYSIIFMPKAYTLMGLYNLIAPAMLTGFVLYYFYKIYKPNRYKMFVENPLERKMVKPEELEDDESD